MQPGTSRLHSQCSSRNINGSAEGKLLSCNVQQVRKKELEIGTIVEDGVDLKKSKDLGLEKVKSTWLDVNRGESTQYIFRPRQWAKPSEVPT